MRILVSVLLIVAMTIAVIVPVAIGVSSGLKAAERETEIAGAGGGDLVEVNLSLSKSDAVISVGEIQEIVATIDQEADSYIFQWKSADETIAQVSKKAESNAVGVITAVNPGDTTITLNVVDKSQFKIVKSAVCNVKVMPAAIKIDIYLDKGNKANVPNNVIPGATDITWTSEDESIATIANGVITAHKAGHVYLIAKSGNIENRLLVNIYESKFGITDEIKYVAKDTTAKINVMGNLGDGAKWTSADESIATVDANGKVTGKKVGVTTVQVTSGYDGQTSSVTVVVKSGSAEAIELKKGKKSDASNNPGVWYYYSESSAATPVSIPKYDNGVIQFKLKASEKLGTTNNNFYLRYQPDAYGDVFYSVTLYIYASQEATVEIDGVQINNNKLTTLSAGWNQYKVDGYKSAPTTASGAYQLKFKSAGEFIVVPVFEQIKMTNKVVLSENYVKLNATDNKTATLSASVVGQEQQTVTWSSSNSGVATVKGGVITAVSEGYAMITATSGDLKAHCIVRVDGATAITGTQLASGNKSATVNDPGKWYYLADGSSKVNSTPIMESDGDIHMSITNIDDAGQKYVYLRYQPASEDVKYKATVTIDFAGAGDTIVAFTGGNITSAVNKDLKNGTNTFEFEFTSNSSNPLQMKFFAIGGYVVNVTLTEI